MPGITGVSCLSIVSGEILNPKGVFTSEANVVTLEGFDGVSLYLSLIREATSQIDAAIPSEMASGNYILTVKIGVHTGDSNLITICDGKPKIFSLKETSLLAGLAEIVIAGNRFKKEGATYFIYFGVAKVKGLTTDDGTVIRAVVPETLPAGTVKVQVQAGLYSYPNEVDVTITENTFPVSTISSSNSVEPLAGDVLEITGANFMTTGNTVRLVSNAYPQLSYTFLAVSECEAVLRSSTTNVLKRPKLDHYVMSNGKDTKYTGTIMVNMTIKPSVITEISPLTLMDGKTITITS